MLILVFSFCFKTSIYFLQALNWEKNANRFHEVTEQLEKALSQISFDKLDISEEVHEQVVQLFVAADAFQILEF